MRPRPPFLPFLAAAGAAALAALLGLELERVATAPTVVVLCDATLGFAEPPAAAETPVPEGPPPQPFSLDDLGRGLLALTTDEATRDDLATRLGDDVRRLARLRADLERQGAERRGVATELTTASMEMVAVLHRGQVDAVLEAEGQGWGTREDPWGPLLRQLEEEP